jgi:hypothetical protein
MRENEFTESHGFIMVWVTLFIENNLIDEIGIDISDFAYRNARKQQENIIKLFYISIAFLCLLSVC